VKGIDEFFALTRLVLAFGKRRRTDHNEYHNADFADFAAAKVGIVRCSNPAIIHAGLLGSVNTDGFYKNGGTFQLYLAT
jgi:hypothetical protein